MMLNLQQFPYIYVGSKLPKNWINKVEGYFPYEWNERSEWKLSSPWFCFPTSPYSLFCERHSSELQRIFGSLLIQAELESRFTFTLLHVKFKNHVFKASLLPHSSFLKEIRDKTEQSSKSKKSKAIHWVNLSKPEHKKKQNGKMV